MSISELKYLPKDLVVSELMLNFATANKLVGLILLVQARVSCLPSLTGNCIFCAVTDKLYSNVLYPIGSDIVTLRKFICPSVRGIYQLVSSAKWQSLLFLCLIINFIELVSTSIMKKTISLNSQISSILSSKSLAEWTALTKGSVIDVIRIWQEAGQGVLIREDIMSVLLNFQQIIDAYFNVTPKTRELC